MGLLPDELYNLTFRQFANKQEGFSNLYEEQCERERMWVGLIISSQPGVKKTFDLAKSLKFAWEQKSIEVNKKEAKKSLERIKKRDKWQTKS